LSARAARAAAAAPSPRRLGRGRTHAATRAHARRSRAQCDICVNNQLALANTGLVGAYARLDARVRPLVAVVKHWAAARKVNEPYLGTLSSYAYVLLTVNYLQTTMPPVLPCLQTLGRPAGAERIVDGYDAWWQDDPRALAAAGFEVGANASSVGELLVGFFRRCGWRRGR
jgi:terminal uridylyltransferase